MTSLQNALTVAVVSCGIMTSAVTTSAQTVHLDAERGRDLAKRLCVNCHVVVPDAEPTDGQVAPDFRAISRFPGQTRERLAGKLIIPHPAMPSISLTMKEVRDIVTYIMSMESQE